MGIPSEQWRQAVRALAESRWREPVYTVYLGDVSPKFDVPGRREDGTIKGRRLIRRFFWNIFRGTIGGALSVVLSVLGGGPAHVFLRTGRVHGPAGAQALGLVDVARRATGPWLVYSASHVAVIDTGFTVGDPAKNPPPEILWHATRPDRPEINPVRRTLTWPDGSVYVYNLEPDEVNIQYRARHADPSDL